MADLTKPKSSMDFSNGVLELYNAGQYSEAIRWIDTWPDLFPETAGTRQYWRACLAGRMGSVEDALLSLRHALELGFFYPRELLENDEDLNLLKGSPAFEEVLQASQKRFEQAQRSAQPACLRFHPSPYLATPPLLMALHGNQSNAAETAPFFQSAVEKGWLLAVPQSSQVRGPGGFIWTDLERSARELAKHYADLQRDAREAFPTVAVAGFSMGAGAAIWAVLSGVVPARGFVLLGPYLPDPDALDMFFQKRNQSVPLRSVIIVGEADHECLPIAKSIAERLQHYGHACRLELLPGLAHVYPPDFQSRLEHALDFISQDDADLRM